MMNSTLEGGEGPEEAATVTIAAAATPGAPNATTLPNVPAASTAVLSTATSSDAPDPPSECAPMVAGTEKVLQHEVLAKLYSGASCDEIKRDLENFTVSEAGDSHTQFEILLSAASREPVLERVDVLIQQKNSVQHGIKVVNLDLSTLKKIEFDEGENKGRVV